VAIHPDCPLHLGTTSADRSEVNGPASEHPSGRRRAATAQTGGGPTAAEQPHGREADGHSPPRAPIPATQQRKQHTERRTPRHEVGSAGTQSEHEGGDHARSRAPAPGPAGAARPQQATAAAPASTNETAGARP
jgi:hypothetical protein